MEAVADAALRFARALDREDYDAAAACIHPECAYVVAGACHRGPDAIVSSYREAGVWGAANLDAVEFESSVRLEADRRAVVTFVDHLRRRGEGWTYRCEQVLDFDEDGLIRRIEHRELPGEAEALRAFFERVGVDRTR